MNGQYRVLLPKWIWKQAANKEEAKQFIMDYMKHYPHYRVVAVKNGFAICQRSEEL
ncbi:hypothetical protein LS684_20975 (plasmid) [Cytobacillus spongiae]|uniref:hypothetical protein n=1 Tax=Cytobacillus spongiae TaxID=2901381 RepID=UPI001F1C309E|nr:hypothetical protein [Cytobacillus spongiae]UII58099.1 hypothetical protein LS684_20975 [Cytobacillus spongiae]